jgi:hypothetical protein
MGVAGRGKSPGRDPLRVAVHDNDASKGSNEMAKSDLNLPPAYLEWLDRLGEEAYVEFDDREWEMARREELVERLSIDGNQARYIEQAKLYVKSIAEATGESATVDQDGNSVPFSRVGGFLTIGRDNEDLLCVDPLDKFSVWCFHPSDGGDVEKLAASLDQWMEQAERN